MSNQFWPQSPSQPQHQQFPPQGQYGEAPPVQVNVPFQQQPGRPYIDTQVQPLPSQPLQPYQLSQYAPPPSSIKSNSGSILKSLFTGRQVPLATVQTSPLPPSPMMGPYNAPMSPMSFHSPQGFGQPHPSQAPPITPHMQHAQTFPGVGGMGSGAGYQPNVQQQPQQQWGQPQQAQPPQPMPPQQQHNQAYAPGTYDNQHPVPQAPPIQPNGAPPPYTAPPQQPPQQPAQYPAQYPPQHPSQQPPLQPPQQPLQQPQAQAQQQQAQQAQQLPQTQTPQQPAQTQQPSQTHNIQPEAPGQQQQQWPNEKSPVNIASATSPAPRQPIVEAPSTTSPTRSSTNSSHILDRSPTPPLPSRSNSSSTIGSNATTKAVTGHVNISLFWGYLFDDTHALPSPVPLLSEFLRCLGKFIVTTWEKSQNVVISPDSMAMLYATLTERGSSKLDFFASARTSPRPITALYRQLGCQYLLIPGKVPLGGQQQAKKGKLGSELQPGLTLQGFEKWMVIQILLSPEREWKRLDRLLKTPEVKLLRESSITTPNGNRPLQPFPSAIPRSALPESASPEIASRFGRLLSPLRADSPLLQELIENDPDLGVDVAMESELLTLRKQIEELKGRLFDKEQECKGLQQQIANTPRGVGEGAGGGPDRPSSALMDARERAARRQSLNNFPVMNMSNDPSPRAATTSPTGGPPLVHYNNRNQQPAPHQHPGNLVHRQSMYASMPVPTIPTPSQTPYPCSRTSSPQPQPQPPQSHPHLSRSLTANPFFDPPSTVTPPRPGTGFLTSPPSAATSPLPYPISDTNPYQNNKNNRPHIHPPTVTANPLGLTASPTSTSPTAVVNPLDPKVLDPDEVRAKQRRRSSGVGGSGGVIYEERERDKEGFKRKDEFARIMGGM